VPKKLLSFPQPRTPNPPVPGATQGSRVIVSVGNNQRFAIDFYRKITELNNGRSNFESHFCSKLAAKAAWTARPRDLSGSWRVGSP
jgi:hypothetical protein